VQSSVRFSRVASSTKMRERLRANFRSRPPSTRVKRRTASCCDGNAAAGMATPRRTADAASVLFVPFFLGIANRQRLCNMHTDTIKPNTTTSRRVGRRSLRGGSLLKSFAQVRQRVQDMGSLVQSHSLGGRGAVRNGHRQRRGGSGGGPPPGEAAAHLTSSGTNLHRVGRAPQGCLEPILNFLVRARALC
jgi:hypothetical protein